MAYFSNTTVASHAEGLSYDIMKLGSKLKRLLRDRRVSQEALGESVGVSQSQAGKWVNDKNIPDAEQLSIIASELKVPVDYLVDDTRDIADIDELDREMLVRELIRKCGVERAFDRLAVLDFTTSQGKPHMSDSNQGNLTERQRELLSLAEKIGEKEAIELLKAQSQLPSGLTGVAHSIYTDDEIKERQRRRDQMKPGGPPR